MSKKEAETLENLIEKTTKAENVLLVKRNKNLAKNLKNYINTKRKLAEFENEN